MDELDWAAYRRRVRTRTSCQMLLIIAPFMALIAILKIVAPMDYSAGDIRNSIEFRLTVLWPLHRFRRWHDGRCGALAAGRPTRLIVR
jgi:hypothetical protein